MSDEPRFAPNGNKLPERLPVGHRLVDTTKQQWLIGPSIGCGGFGDIYLTREYDESRDDLKRLTQEHIIKESDTWTNVIKFEHFSGPLFAEINFYIRCARRETIDEYMVAKKLKHLGMPRFVASGIYDPLRDENPPPVCKNTMSVSVKQPPAKRGKLAQTNGVAKRANGVNGVNGNNQKQRRIPASQVKEKKYRFLVLERFGDDVEKILNRSNGRFNMNSAFNIALKVIDTLEYIHSHGYVHADVKASNLLIDWRGKQAHSNGKAGLGNDTTKAIQNGGGALKRARSKTGQSNGVSKANGRLTNGKSTTPGKDSIEPEDQLYLVDFGLVERFYHKDGTHREHVEDQRRANNGTIEFSSRDAHIGAFSRRSDLESLAYNLLYWVSGGRLPWTACGGKDHQLVEASKKWYMSNLEVFVNYCFNEDAQPIDPIKVLRGLDSTRNGSTASSSTLDDNSRAPATSKSSSTKSSKSSTKTTATTTTSSRSSLSSRSSKSSKASSTADSIMCASLYDFLSYITKLEFEDEPDYILLKTILMNALGGNQPTTGRSARKQRGIQVGIKKSPQRLPECKNPTPAMREILKRMNLGSKKR